MPFISEMRAIQICSTVDQIGDPLFRKTITSVLS